MAWTQKLRRLPCFLRFFVLFLVRVFVRRPYRTFPRKKKKNPTQGVWKSDVPRLAVSGLVSERGGKRKKKKQKKAKEYEDLYIARVRLELMTLSGHFSLDTYY